MITRIATLWLAVLLAPVSGLAAARPAPAAPAPGTARYEVRLLSRAPLRLGVQASLPIAGQDLGMAISRPGNVPELLQSGWPALVGRLSVRDEGHRRLALQPSPPGGWRLERPHAGRIELSYEVDYGLLQARQWPALREAAYGEGDTFALIGRSLFLTTPATASIEVAFALPAGWHASTAWAGDGAHFSVASVADLTENLLVLGRSPPTVVEASGFRVVVAPFGGWHALDEDLAATLQPLLTRFVHLMALEGRQQYLVVLLPGDEAGGESFRASFAMTWAGAPTRDERHAWGTMIGHEIFHYWNGWRLHGAEYAASQWFQEGFTEYVAVQAALRSGLMTPAQFLENLSAKVNASRRLQTPLDAPGTHKGPPLYGAGALVALSWDLAIRERSDDRRSLDDFLRALWRRSRQGELAYSATDILAALEETAPGDWQAFYRRHVAAREPLPLEATLARLGLRLVEGKDGQAVVAADPSAPAAARERWLAYIAGR
jgi:predicted metalloprotease with PDZ domain